MGCEIEKIVRLAEGSIIGYFVDLDTLNQNIYDLDMVRLCATFGH